MRVTLDLSERDIRLILQCLRGCICHRNLRARSKLAAIPRSGHTKWKKEQQRKAARRYSREAGTMQRIAKAFEKYQDA
jgi:hypothetical protein